MQIGLYLQLFFRLGMVGIIKFVFTITSRLAGERMIYLSSGKLILLCGCINTATMTDACVFG